MKNNNIKELWPLLVTLVIYFTLCAGYFFSYSMGDFPDGLYHMGYVYDVFLHNYPNYVGGTNFISEKLNYLNHPPLYYLLAGGLTKVDYTGNHIVGIAQSVNVIISLLTLAVTWKALKNLKFSRVGIFCGLLMILLTPMFMELSVAVNNDPLSILGCAIAFYGVVNCYADNSQFNHSILLIILGGVIAALTKGTGALTIVCIVGTHVLFNIKLWWALIKKINISQWIVVIFFTVVVVSYYAVTYKVFHALFPAPQGNPADWFAFIHPDAPRWNIIEYASYFLISNYNTYITPYGHSTFVDSDTRLLSLNAFLLIFTFLLLIIGAFLRKDKFLSVSIISFILYMIFYFYTIRQLHLQTGYLGAMQARYFYGFLPLFSVGVASVFDGLKNRFLRIPFSLLLFFNIALAFIPAWAKVNPLFQNDKIVEQNDFNSTFGELFKWHVFSQSFEAKTTNLESISLKLATFSRSNTDTIKIQVCTMAGQCMFSKEIDTQHLVDNDWLSLPVNISNLTVGNQYMISLTSLTGKPGNAITWWALQQPSEDPHFAHTQLGPTVLPVKSYEGGEAAVDGQLVPNVDFAFRVIFK